MRIIDITDPSFLKDQNIEQLNKTCEDIRDFLIKSISETGGHLSSNLGIVELTVALHYVFESPKDKFIFDVGHQSYVHKILTGRVKQFDTLRKYKGLSGFQKICESPHDFFEAGHSSTSISAASSFAVARDLNKESFEVISIVGDASIVGGESFEALNFLGARKNKLIIILNDNQMLIGKPVGGFNNFLNQIRVSTTYNNIKEDYKNVTSLTKIGKTVYGISHNVKNFLRDAIVSRNIFDDLGFEYIGPIDGHNLSELIKALKKAKRMNRSVVLHVHTVKGKGYHLAECDQDGKWHGTAPFIIETGEVLTNKVNKVSWSAVVANQVEKHMHHDNKIVTVTPAMVKGSGLTSIFENFPNRSFDVGIAEAHGATFVAGLSLGGLKPFYSVYSSFSQRCYDQINHDIARMNTPALICLDRAGLVGADGPTHHGVFDLSIFQALPNVVIFAPSCAREAKEFINSVFNDFNSPYIMRISKNSVADNEVPINQYLEIGSWEIINNLDYDLTIITYGDNINAIKDYYENKDLKVRIINARFIKPLDYKVLDKILVDDKPLIIYETDMEIGSLSDRINAYNNKRGFLKKLYCMGLKDKYTTHGDVQSLLKEHDLDLDSLNLKLREIINEKTTS